MNSLVQHQLPEIENTDNVYHTQTKNASENHIQNFAIDESNILAPFIKLCDAIKKYDVGKNEKENKIAAQQALQLVQSGGVSGIGTNKIYFHTINNITIGKSIVKEPISFPINKEKGITNRPIFLDIMKNEHGSNGIWIEQLYLDSAECNESIQQILATKNQYIATYENFFGPIFSALEGSDYVRRRTIQLLTNINDIIVMDRERDQNKKRRFGEFSYHHAFVKSFAFDSCNGSLYIAENC